MTRAVRNTLNTVFLALNWTEDVAPLLFRSLHFLFVSLSSSTDTVNDQPVENIAAFQSRIFPQREQIGAEKERGGVNIGLCMHQP